VPEDFLISIDAGVNILLEEVINERKEGNPIVESSTFERDGVEIKEIRWHDDYADHGYGYYFSRDDVSYVINVAHQSGVEMIDTLRFFEAAR
jgi:hypothetical protein